MKKLILILFIAILIEVQLYNTKEVYYLTADEKEILTDMLNQERNNIAHEFNFSNVNKVDWNDSLNYCVKQGFLEKIRCGYVYDEMDFITPVNYSNNNIKLTFSKILNLRKTPDIIYVSPYKPEITQISCIKIENDGILKLACMVVSLQYFYFSKRGEVCSNCKFWNGRDCNAIAYDGLCGLSGPRGYKGEKGDMGIKGYLTRMFYNPSHGENGDKGESGDKGIPTQSPNFGATGQDGRKGESGKTPDYGIRGEKGDKGDRGDIGAPGLKGEKGQKGPQGKIIPLKSKIYYKDPKFWIIYIALWIGLIKNAIIFIIRQRRKQGNYFPLQTETKDKEENTLLEQDQSKSNEEIEAKQLETGISGHDTI